jgi:hypothetical protein
MAESKGEHEGLSTEDFIVSELVIIRRLLEMQTTAIFRMAAHQLGTSVAELAKESAGGPSGIRYDREVKRAPEAGG